MTLLPSVSPVPVDKHIPDARGSLYCISLGYGFDGPNSNTGTCKTFQTGTGAHPPNRAIKRSINQSSNQADTTKKSNWL